MGSQRVGHDWATSLHRTIWKISVDSLTDWRSQSLLGTRCESATQGNLRPVTISYSKDTTLVGPVHRFRVWNMNVKCFYCQEDSDTYFKKCFQHILLKSVLAEHTAETERASEFWDSTPSSEPHLIKQTQNLHCKSLQIVKFSIFIKKKIHQMWLISVLFKTTSKKVKIGNIFCHIICFLCLFPQHCT